MANKKAEIEIVNPHVCVRSLNEYLERLFGLRSIMPDVIEYIENTPNENGPLKEFMVKAIKKHYESINEFHKF